MMDELISNLLEHGIFLSLDQDKLKIKYNGDSIPPDLLDAVKKNKAELITYLSSVKVNYEEISPLSGPGPYELSSAQKRLWVLSQFEEGVGVYNMPSSIFPLKSNDIEFFKKAIDATIDRHEILRTVFKVDEQGEVKQWVLSKDELGFQIDFQNFCDEEDKEAKLDQYREQDSYRTFDLEHGPLIRMTVVQMDADNCLFYYNMHHILGDEWSMDVLSKDVFTYYEAFRKNLNPTINELRIQYKDYSAWQLAQLETEDYKNHKSYWLNNLSGELPQLNLPNAKKRPLIKTNNGRTLSTYLNVRSSKGLKAFSQENGGTVFMGLLASFNAILFRYTEQEDMIIGSPMAGREHTDLTNQIGFYLNTLALRNHVKGSDTFKDLFLKIKTSTLAAYAHQAYPFDRLVEELDLKRDTSRTPVFDIMLTLLDKDDATEGLSLNKEGENQIIETGAKASKFDLLLFAQEQGDRFSFSIEYNTDVYEGEMIENLMVHYQRFLSVWLLNPEEALENIDYLSAQERTELLETFNNTAVDYGDKTVMELFEAQVLKTPNQIALVFENETRTYQELNAQSNRLAHHLRNAHQISNNSRVGVMLERSIESVIAMFGIMKTGACYVPIDHNYPESRVAFIVKDSNADVIISQQELANKHIVIQDDLMRIDEHDLTQGDAENLKRVNELKDESYIIYTSGSTGQPKGVVQTHQMLHNLVHWDGSESGIERGLKHLQYTSFNFDVSLQDYWTALSVGGSVYITNEAIRTDFTALWSYIKEHEIAVLSFPFSAFRALVLQNSDQELKLADLKHVVCSGEQLIINPSIHAFLESNPTLKLHNHYGPSETHVISSYSLSAEQGNTAPYVLIGKPVSNTQIYILDKAQKLVPHGVEGELYIGGKNLALGYLNRDDLGKDKFVQSPFRSEETLYKTGDIGTWLPDGNLVYLGRKDDQVKIRGYRIELEEIAQSLLKHEQIEQAVVLARNTQETEQELIAYITAKSEQNISELSAYLKQSLPAYMLPTFFVQLAEFPLTANGKIDKRALPDPKGLELNSGVVYVAPRNEIEAGLVEIWEDVLSRDKIGIKDDFFELGGQSIKAIKVIGEYHKMFNVKLSISDIFINTTIELQADLLAGSKKDEFIQIEKLAPQINYTISDAQRRIWVLSQFEEGLAAYNMPDSIVLNQEVDIENFKKAISATIKRHEILRTVFKKDDTGEIRQWILKVADLGFEIDYQDFRGGVEQADALATYISDDTYQPFDLENGPLLRAALLQTEDETFVFYYNMHHIISDGWSMDVLSHDVLTFYDVFQEISQPDITVAELSELRIQYKDYAAWQVGQVQNEANKEHKAYWLDKLAGDLSHIDLPTHKQRPKIKSNNGTILSTFFDEKLSQGLKAYVQEQGGSLFMGLLASLNAILYRYSNQQDLIIGTPIAGREHSDLENQIGFYVNSLALRNRINPTDSFNDLFTRVKENTLKAYAHQLYPFDRLVDELNLERDTSRSAVFDMALVLQNIIDNTADFVLPKVELDEIVNQGYSPSKFDIDFTFQETGNYLALLVVFNPDLYDEEMVRGLIRHFKQILNELLENPGTAIGEIGYLSKEEEQELQITFNNTASEYLKGDTVVDLFSSQAEKTPNDIAVEFEGTKLTYQELNEQSNRLAHYLNEKYNAQPNDLIGIKLTRSEWTIIAILGVLKSGAAYVPIDPEYPQDRIDYIESDTQCKVCIDQMEIDSFKNNQINYPIHIPNTAISAHQLAYIIYTSGSTGKPKGVMIEHGNLSQFLHSCLANYQSQSTVVQPFVASAAFDISVFQLFLPLISGGKSIVVSKAVFQDPAKFIEILKVSSVIDTVPAMYESIINHILAAGISDSFNGIEKVFIGGDRIPDQLLNDLANVFSSASIIVTYGPTEGTIFCTDHHYDKGRIADYNGSIIGTPNNNVSIHLLNQNEKHEAKGVIGEICIGGGGIARGYLNQPELTDERFIKNPFVNGERLYKTGDLGRWLSDGRLEFMGRIDDQVKIRGYRIELGEIEAALLTDNSVSSAVVIARLDEEKKYNLVAYLVSDVELVSKVIRQQLGELIPDYMIPAQFVQMESLPLTANGKVDKKGLPNPEGLVIESGIEYVAPRNEVEQKLTKIWEDVLKKVDIGIDEGFFDAGGNSIKLITLKAKIEQEFGLSCPIASLFQFSSVRQQADMFLKENQQVDSTSFTQDKPVFGGSDNETDIAIIGMSIRTPKAKNSVEFWDNLTLGKESVTHFNDEDLRLSGVADEELEDQNFVKARAYLENKACFDASFFRYLPDEAKLIDPQTRVFHETVWSALEDAGYDPHTYNGLIGLFAGSGSNLEWEAYSVLSGNNSSNEFAANKLTNKDFISALIAHKLNLKGAAQAINTACSTSLVAIHQAALSILSGENHMAVAGGVSIRNKEKTGGYQYIEGMILSQDGHNRTFDAEASGTVDAEGSGAVVLKKLSAAQADGDQIYAVLKGSAINNDGDRKVGFTAPSVSGQSEVIQMAQRSANVSPESISYIEAHGTATKLGDPIEMRALTQAFGKSESKYCAVGSVKSNLGHLDAAAGVAGFIKAVLCLKHKQLVPSLHFNSPNPEINFEESPFYVNTELKTWDKTDFPRRAGISSFGIGGTNAHVILEEAPEIEKTPISKEFELIPLSAKTPEALIRQVDNLKAFLVENPTLSLADVAWSLQNRSAFSYRSAIVANSVEQAITKLETWASQSQLPTVKGKRIAFMFSGQGAQYENMGRGLYDDPSSIFRKSMDTCFELAAKESTTDFKSILYPTEPNQAKPVNETINTQPILFMFEYALAKQLAFYGIHPDIMIGHSIGEYVAACLSGVLSLETALQLVIKRGALMQNLPKGDMLAIGASSDSIKTYLTDKVDIAAVNTPDSCTVSGEPVAIAALLTQLEQENIPAKTLHTSHAFHSGMMDPMLDEFTSVVSKVEMSTPSIPYISNVTGKEIKAEELTQEYWSNHIRGAVKFSAGINEIQSEGNTIFIEVGPGHSLSTLARQHIHTKGTSTAHQLIRHVKTNEADDVFFMEKLAQLWQAGIDMDWSQLNLNKAKHKISLPTYPFERIKYPMATGLVELLSNSMSSQHYEKKPDMADWFYELSWKQSRLLPTRKRADETVNYLIFSDNEGLAEGLINAIMQNEPEAKICQVKKGHDYDQISDFSYVINPQKEADYTNVFEALKKSNSIPTKILHLWSYNNVETQKETTYDSTVTELELGYYSLLHIAKSIGLVCPFQKLGLDVITNFTAKVNSEDEIFADRSAILGPILTIPKEYNTISCRNIDLKSSDLSEAFNGLLAEISAEYIDPIIAYRNGDRWTQCYEKVRLVSNDELPTKLKKDGVYLITGGVGGMGLVFSKYLAKEFNAKLILCGRKPKSDFLTKRLEEISTEIIYINADVSDAEEMESRLTEAEGKFGTIDGIIHAAGIGDYAGIIQNRTKEKNEEVFAAKIYGTIVLNQIARKRNVDTLILCSSGAALAAPFGQVAYTAANIFQDSFARANNTGNVQSIGWDTWSESGMGVEAVSQLSDQEKFMRLGHGLTNDEGVEVLKRILNYRIPSLSVLTRDIEVLFAPEISPLNAEKEEEQFIQERAALSAVYEPPETITEHKICELFENYYSIKEIGIKDDFFDLGMDSLKAMSLIGLIHQKMNIELIINDILENANIHDLSKKIDSLENINKMEEGRSNSTFKNKIEI